MKSLDALQGELPLLAMLRKPSAVDEGVIEGFGELEDTAVVYAAQWAWANRRIKGLTQKEACCRTGMREQHFSCILKGAKYLPPGKINAFEWAVGNTAVSQTIERFKKIRERQMADQLARLVSDSIMRAA